VDPTDANEQFTRLWTAAQPAVANLVFAAIPDFQQAEDVLQDVAVVLFRKFQEYDAARPFTRWALAIARFEVLGSKRRQARSLLQLDPELVGSLAERCMEMKPEFDARSAAVQRCLEQLKNRAMELVRLRYDNGLPPREIAARLHSTSLRIRARLNRIRTSLRRCIQRQLRMDLLPES
jgi:RNA polymerase sigma-70 factor, ECF subfamily